MKKKQTVLSSLRNFSFSSIYNPKITKKQIRICSTSIRFSKRCDPMCINDVSKLHIENKKSSFAQTKFCNMFRLKMLLQTRYIPHTKSTLRTILAIISIKATEHSISELIYNILKRDVSFMISKKRFSFLKAIPKVIPPE